MNNQTIFQMEFLKTVDLDNASASNITELPSTSQNYGDLQACKVCLTTSNENEVFLLQKYNLSQLFEEITGVAVSPDDGTPQHICQPCGFELQKCAAFLERCQQVDVLMRELLCKTPVITTSQIQELDRTKYQEPLLFYDILTQPELKIDPKELDTEDSNVSINIEEEIKYEDEYNLDSPSDLSENKSLLKTILEGKIDRNTDLVKTKDDNTLETIKDRNTDMVKTKDDNTLETIKDTMSHKKEKKTKKTKKKRLYNQKTEEDFEMFSKTCNVDVIFLTKEQKINEVLARKQSEEYANSRFKCEKCYRGFMNDSAYKKHMKTHDPSSGNHECDICFVRFVTRPKLLSHLRKHRAHFVCKTCNKISKSAALAKKHYQWHEGLKYVCKHCSKNFSVYSSYLNHVRENHTPVTCKLCNETVNGTRKLTDHNNVAHKGLYKCLSCNAQFHNNEALARHTSFSNGNSCEALRSCLQCGDGFLVLEELKQHMTTVHKEIAHTCDLCSATFLTVKSLENHWKKAHTENNSKASDKNKEANLMCEVCAKSYPNETALRYHQRIHTGEKPFQCSMCPKSFRIKTALQVHLNTHTGNRTYKCALCPEAFKSYSQRYKHRLLVHTKERRHKCHLCEKTYVVKCDLTSHIRTAHMKLPYPPRNRRKKQKTEG